jgi:hypothetical protein
VTRTESYYDWELDLKTKPSHKKNRKNSKENLNNLGLSFEDFRKFIELWRRKNIVF